MESGVAFELELEREIECGGGRGSFRVMEMFNLDCGIGCTYPSLPQDTLSAWDLL